MSAPAKCDYCGRYGPLGSCEGCGAPNVPVYVVDVTTFNDPVPRVLGVRVPSLPKRCPDMVLR